MAKETAKSGGADVSKDRPDINAQQAAGVNPQTANATQALQTTGDGDVSGSLQLALSSETQDALMQEMQDALHQVSEGFGELAKPGDIYKAGETFTVIDAITIPDFEDKRKGEIMVKHIFKLEFPDGRIKLVMQGDARPRRLLARSFQIARTLGQRIKAGPYIYGEKPITGQPQPAFIFVQQPGFHAGPY